MDTQIQETVEELLNKLCTPFRRVRLEKKDDTYKINIESEEPSLLIGHHGENIYALQNIIRVIMWNKHPGDYNILIDVDNYRQRQEENVLKLAERKVETAIKTGEMQSLPPMSSYFRRVIHLHLAKQFENVVTESVGEGDFRYLTIKPKTLADDES